MGRSRSRSKSKSKKHRHHRDQHHHHSKKERHAKNRHSKSNSKNSKSKSKTKKQTQKQKDDNNIKLEQLAQQQKNLLLKSQEAQVKEEKEKRLKERQAKLKALQEEEDRERFAKQKQAEEGFKQKFGFLQSSSSSSQQQQQQCINGTTHQILTQNENIKDVTVNVAGADDVEKKIQLQQQQQQQQQKQQKQQEQEEISQVDSKINNKQLMSEEEWLEKDNEEDDEQNCNNINDASLKTNAIIQEEEDPLEQFMKGIEAGSVPQERTTLCRGGKNSDQILFSKQSIDELEELDEQYQYQDDLDNEQQQQQQSNMQFQAQMITLEDLVRGNNANQHLQPAKSETTTTLCDTDAIQRNEQFDFSDNVNLNQEQNNNNNQQQQETDDDDDFYAEFMSQMKEQKLKEKLIDEHQYNQSEQQLPFALKDVALSKDEAEEDFLGETKKSSTAEEDDYFAKRQKLEAKRVLQEVDHSKIDYEPFRKNFYIESPDIRNVTPMQVQKQRELMGHMTVAGQDCPNPVTSWYHCGLSDKMLSLLTTKMHFEAPFHIQAQALPVILSGRDCIGIAETGSGKTLAYLLPMLRHIQDQRPLKNEEGPIALILVPTRELAVQIYRAAQPFCKALGVRMACVYGGSGLQGQLSDLKRGCEAVVCTPGRMIEVLHTSNGKITNLRRVTFVVLDEADRMFDLGFAPQISRILNNIRPDRQTVLFSATFPKNVETLARSVLRAPIEVLVGQKGQVCENIEQIVKVIQDPNHKFMALLELLNEWNSKGQILIFVDKQLEADMLFKELYQCQYSCLVLHGGQDQDDRDYTILDFKKRVRNILVATSVCARGLDIKGLRLVVNYNCPSHLEDYVHRIGRTGRAGNKGTAITFITPQEDSRAYDILRALKMSQSLQQSQAQEASKEKHLEKIQVQIPDALVELVKGFKKKVELGEAKVFSNANTQGSGFKFDQDEQRRLRDARQQIKKEFGIEMGQDEYEDEEEIFNKNALDKQIGGGEAELEITEDMTEEEKQGVRNKMAKKQQKDKEKLMKNQQIKDLVMQAGIKAAKDALAQGKQKDEVLGAAKRAQEDAIQEYLPGAGSLTQGLTHAVKVVDEALYKQQLNSDIVTADILINDYPEIARKKVIKPDFLAQIEDLTNCDLSLRGQYYDPLKKLPIGAKKLHIHISGENKGQVVNAYREIKDVLEEAAKQNLYMLNQTTAQSGTSYTI